ncbi:hypothetical protein C8J56DRAFT_1059661 [Mycena floridula]|nr:hypothetical protein C8J56DRAFT_1059661 [Mycena floridula]
MSEKNGSAFPGHLDESDSRQFRCFRLSFTAESAASRFLSAFHGHPFRKTPFLRAHTRSTATNRKIFSEFHKPNFFQFMQSDGLICYTPSPSLMSFSACSIQTPNPVHPKFAHSVIQARSHTNISLRISQDEASLNQHHQAFIPEAGNPLIDLVKST